MKVKRDKNSGKCGQMIFPSRSDSRRMHVSPGVLSCKCGLHFRRQKKACAARSSLANVSRKGNEQVSVITCVGRRQKKRARGLGLTGSRLGRPRTPPSLAVTTPRLRDEDASCKSRRDESEVGSRRQDAMPKAVLQACVRERIRPDYTAGLGQAKQGKGKAPARIRAYTSAQRVGMRKNHLQGQHTCPRFFAFLLLSALCAANTEAITAASRCRRHAAERRAASGR